MRFANSSQIKNSREGGVAKKLSRSKLDKLREELMLPWKVLDELCLEKEGRKAMELTETENRRVREYLERNRLHFMQVAKECVWR